MPTLNWCDDLALDIAAMDTTHQESVALLGAVESADDGAVLAAWQAPIDHTAGALRTEDRYMLATRFAATNCQTTHHQMVLDVLRQGLAMGQAGDLAPIRQMTRELATWFPQHADSMDAALAMHLQRVGFDPTTGAMANSPPLPAEAIHGWGAATCMPQDAGDHAAAPA